MNALSPLLQSLLSLVVALMVLAALFLLWRRDRSPWLLAAMIGEAIGLAFRALVIVQPQLLGAVPALFSLWTLTALVFAIGLLGYAIERNQGR